MSTRPWFQHTAARRRLDKIGTGNAEERHPFQHTAARRRLGRKATKNGCCKWFQHTAARRRLAALRLPINCLPMFQHTAARRRLGHARRLRRGFARFNTQPPEGGWRRIAPHLHRLRRFNTQPPEGGWAAPAMPPHLNPMFQHTAARRRLQNHRAGRAHHARFNTQPPEGGWTYWSNACVG